MRVVKLGKFVENFKIFVLISLIVCIFYAIAFRPISFEALGDSYEYIELAKQFAGLPNNMEDYSHRQPLYSMIIWSFIVTLGEDNFIVPLMWFQFLLVFISSLMIFKIFESLKLFRSLPFLAGLLYLFNLSTIHYGYNILTETLALFLFITNIYLLFKYAKNARIKILVLVGIVNGSLVLARFNTIGIPIITLFCLSLIHYFHYDFRNFKGFVIRSFVYVLTVSIILNIWMLHNFFERGYYGIIQKDHPRFALVIYSRINENIIVSDEHKEILKIFLDAKQRVLHERADIDFVQSKGSLLRYPFFASIYSFFKDTGGKVGGWALYQEAQQELLDYFDLPSGPPESISELSVLLRPFNQEIRKRTKSVEIKQRFSALFQTFRHTGGTIPTNEPVNLNMLPSVVFLFYRLMFFSIMFLTYVFSIWWFFSRLRSIKNKTNYLLYILLLLVFYFPVIHFVAITPGDAARFKFPAEPVLLGLFVYYVFMFYDFLKLKYLR